MTDKSNFWYIVFYMTKLFQSDILFYLDFSALHNRAVQLLSRPVRLRWTLKSHEAKTLHVHMAIKSVYKSILNYA